MKKLLFGAIANWLRKPENREKAKRTARDLHGRYQNRKSSPDRGPKR